MRRRKLLLARAGSLEAEDRQEVEVVLSRSEDLTRVWLPKEEFLKFVDAGLSVVAEKALDSFRYYAKRIHFAEFKECLRMLNNWEKNTS